MNVGCYLSASSLAALERWQTVISENIASGSAPGFKKTEATFSSVLGWTGHVGGEGALGQPVRGEMPTSITQINTQQGELRTTGGDTDFAIQGPGFFQVQRPNGEVGYTRDGEFHLNAERMLVTKQGFPVMGDNGPITLGAGGGRLSVNADGVLLQGETPVGRLAVYDFSEPQNLRRMGDGLFRPTGNAAPESVERPAVLNGALEGSNVSPLREMVNLIAVARAYEANQRVIFAHDGHTGKAIETLGNPNP